MIYTVETAETLPILYIIIFIIVHCINKPIIYRKDS